MKLTPTPRNRRNLFTLLCVISFLLLNTAGHKAVERFSLKLDLTENALYEFSDLTVQTARSLSTDVQIKVFSREEDYVVMLREVLKRFSALSPRINVEFIDPLQNPVLVDAYAARGLQIHENDILLEGPVREKVYSIEDLYTLNGSRTQITGLNAEQQLTSALYYINDSHVPVAAFTDGHNERPGESLMSLFTANNYELARGNLSSLIQRNPGILVIAAPSRDFTDEEIPLLHRYMDQGGKALVFLEPSSVPFPRLEGFLAQWGIRAGEELVLEEQAYTAGNPVNIVPMYGPHEINRYFMETRIFLTMPSARSLYEFPDAGTAYKIRTVLASTPGSYGKQGYGFSSPDREAGDPQGPFNLVMSSEKSLDNGSVSRLVAAGSMKMYGDDLMGFSSYGNSEFLVQTINWLSDEQSLVHIPPKKIKSDPLNLQSGQILSLGILVCALIPVLFLTAGILMLVRRKRL
ncbi:MAG: GldG family protein [Spirochaetales bacterium]|nr:GldG family protein [Spirochaetales bacterium]